MLPGGALNNTGLYCQMTIGYCVKIIHKLCMEFLAGYASVKASIYEDNSGRKIDLPILVSCDGPVKPLLQYQLLHRSKSLSWHAKLHQAVRSLLLYAAANRDCYVTPRELFAGFSVRLISGTIGTDGLDPSGLYWIPKRPSYARQMVRMLTEFSAWSAREFGLPSLIRCETPQNTSRCSRPQPGHTGITRASLVTQRAKPAPGFSLASPLLFLWRGLFQSRIPMK
jgi:hypothetical protein